MRKAPRIGVALTDDARLLLKEDPIFYLLVDGTYFNCESAEQVGSFLRMKIEHNDPPNPSRVFELEIPVHFVLYTFTGDARSRLGFDS